jgi:hypothetical protein
MMHLWYKNRQEVYQPSETTTVFIGSSRIKFDLDIATWEKTTGEKAVQLAVAGSDPKLTLDNLANDEKFKGKLVIDITEGLFFRPQDDAAITKRLKYLKEATPSQKFSAQIGFGLESQLLFLDKDMFALGALLDQLKIPNRSGVNNTPIFPTKFTYTNFRRQEIMTNEFVHDTAMQNKVKGIWTIYGALEKRHGITGDTLQKIFTEVKTDIARIKARGGKVIFTRTPSSGGYRELELKNYPRAEYFDQLLYVSGCNGIYFTDYPELKDFICPEWSHLTPPDAVKYTTALIKILDQNKWFTPHAN